MPDKPNVHLLLRILYLALGTAAAWLFIRYVLLWLLPFIIAYIVARLIEPLVRLLCRKLHFRRALSSAVCTLLVYGAIAGAVYLIVSRIIFEAGELLRQIPDLIAKLPPLTERLREKVYELIIAVPSELQDFLSTSFENFMSRGITIPANLYSFLATFVSSTVLSLPSAMLFVAASILSTYFLSRDYKSIATFVIRQFPRGFKEKFTRTRDHLVGTFGKWLRAQGILMGMTFVETAVGLAIAGVESFLLMALIVAFVDALPVIGSGAVLVPWGVITIFAGSPGKGTVIILLYVVVSFIRSLAEPRLVGKQIGLHPLVAVASMYIGFKAVGIWGILLFPLAVMLIKQFQEWDYIKIWK